MTYTDLLKTQIQHHLDNNLHLTVDTFRDMYINGLPGRLSFLAISRDGQKILPIFDTVTTDINDVVDYTVIRNVLGSDWTPVISAHVWNRLPGLVPQTLLGVDGIIDEKVLHTVYGVLPRWTRTMDSVYGFSFGRFDTKTLPTVSMYSVDREGARRIHTMNKGEGKVRDLMLDHYGMIRYLDVDTHKIVRAFLEVGKSELSWNVYDL